MSPATWAAAILAFTNIGLLLALTYVYIQNYRSLKSYFTLGLVIFSVLFVIFNVSIVGLWFILFTNIRGAELLVGQAMTWMLAINLAQLLGLLALFRITIRY